ncbi:MAG: GNAT family N-acetyltransferase, partial [Daejeonella sp.]
ICIASFYQNNCSLFSAETWDDAVGYQLRGMATLPGFQGRGMGNQLLNFAIIYLRGQKINYLWCNARKNAFHFYKSIGFEFISDEFEIEGIGTHRSMYLKIQ